MFSFRRRLLPLCTLARFSVQTPLRASLQWKSTGSDEGRRPPGPGGLFGDFDYYKKNADALVTKLPTKEELEALEEKWKQAPPEYYQFFKQIEQFDTKAMLHFWRGSVRMTSTWDEAILDFVVQMNQRLRTNLTAEQLERPIFVEGVCGFLGTYSYLTTILPYDKYVSKLEELVASIRAIRRMPVLSYRYNKIPVVCPHVPKVDAAHYNIFFNLTNDWERSLDSLHFICGDSGSGKTHFAIHAGSEVARRYSSSVIPFYIYTRDITREHKYEELVCEDENVKKYRKERNEEKENEARTVRDELAKEILVDAMELLISPYRLLDGPLPTEERLRPYAIVILDEAIHSVPLLHALTSKGSQTAVRRLNEHYKSVFRRVIVIAASTVSKEYLELVGCSRDRLIAFNMAPGIELLREGLAVEGANLEALRSYWLNNQLFSTIMNNRRCAAFVLHHVSNVKTASVFQLLNSIFAEVEQQFQELEAEERVKKSDALIKEKRNELANVCVHSRDTAYTPHYPFKDLMTGECSYARFANAMLKFTAWLSVEAVAFYKSQNALADLTPLERRDIVMRGVFLCVTGNVAKLHPERKGRLTEEDPITKGVATIIANVTGAKENDKYSIGLHQIAMAMVNHFGEDEKIKSTKDSNLSHTLPDDALKNLQGFLPLGGQEAEAFFCRLLEFLCECVFEARVRKDALSLLDIHHQFIWPGPSAVSGRLEELLLQKLNDAASDAKAVTTMYSNVVYPTGGDSSSESSPEDILNAFCADIKERDKSIRIVLNGPGAVYANVCVVCGDVLLLVSVKRQEGYGTDADMVRQDIATLGFDVGVVKTERGEVKDYSAQRNGTENLAKELGCKYAVPVLALFKEPSPQLEGHLPLVKVCELGNTSQSMKPLVLYIKPTLEHVVTPAAQSWNSSE